MLIWNLQQLKMKLHRQHHIPLFFFYLSIFLYLLLLYIILWTLLYCVTNQLFLPLSITKNISSIVSLSYHLHIFLFICKYAILFDYAIIQQIGMEEYLLILNIEYYLLNLDIKNFIYLIFYLFILIYYLLDIRII